jgi:predicted HD phosphohydrolase
MHDIGDELAPANHATTAAAIIGPYVGARLTWVVEHHTIFQLKHYGQHIGEDPDLRDCYRDSQYFDDTAEFCEYYDENCFDPGYRAMNLNEFEQLVNEVFLQKVARVLPPL